MAASLGIDLVPGYFNSDLIENWFSQMCSLRNGANQNPTVAQIGPAINSNLITGSIVSEKGNTGLKFYTIVQVRCHDILSKHDKVTVLLMVKSHVLKLIYKYVFLL